MSQAAEVENQLRKMILDMQLGPGERLTERWAESCFKASRTPIRAALQKLESEGLICREGRRWMVAPIDIREVEQLYVYREVLEVAAIKLAASRLTSEQLDRLAAQLDANEQEENASEVIDNGTRFHLQLASYCDNVFIQQGLEDVLQRLSRVRWLDRGAANPAWNEHREIIASLREQDSARASELLCQHLRESRSRLLAILAASKRSLRASGAITA